MNAPGPRCYAFGRFRFDPLRGRLTEGDAVVELRPKSLAVLHHLITHPQRLVGKDELLDAVWGKVVVTEDSLVECVREIRQAFGDTDQKLIRTIPRQGYVFSGDVDEEPPPAFDGPMRERTFTGRDGSRWRDFATLVRTRPLAASTVAAALGAVLVLLAIVYSGDGDRRTGRPAATAPSAAPPLSIAVLPLANIDGDPAHEYFADGLTSDLTTDLGRIPASHVVSHGSVRGFKDKPIDSREVGRAFGVRYVLEGSVQRLHDDVRVNLRLIDAESGAQRWAERFEGPRAELPRMQEDIVRRIARTLEMQLLEAEAERSARERTRNPDAQDLLMRGWALWDRRLPADNARARELFTQALAIDPKYSLAWVALANTHISDLHAGWSNDRETSLHGAAQAMTRAYEVGPRHRDVNAGRGYVYFFQGEIELALAAFDQEIDANPGNALAHVWRGLMLISLNRPADALPSIERGIALSPRDPDLNVFYRSMAHAYLSLGRYDEALSWSQKAIAHTPKYAKGYGFLAASAALKGDDASAAVAVESFRRLQPRYSSAAAFRQSMMPGEVRMFDATPRFWEGLVRAGLPAD